MAMDQNYCPGSGQSAESNGDQPATSVKDVTDQLGEMMLGFEETHGVGYYSVSGFAFPQPATQPPDTLQYNPSLSLKNNNQAIYNEQPIPMQITPDSSDLSQAHFTQPTQQQDTSETNNNILVVTNVDSSIYTDNATRHTFENLFLAFDSHIIFRYLKSFRRVRLDFSSGLKAAQARDALDRFKLGPDGCELRCYQAHMIKPPSSYNSQPAPGNQSLLTNTHLAVPKSTKQFLISPPASPPVDWEPVQENSPCIGVELISALANLVPGQVHEIHPACDANPGIFVEVCEEPQFESSMRSCSRIPRTMSPGCCR